MKTPSNASRAVRLALPIVSVCIVSGCVGGGKPSIEDVLGSVDLAEQNCMARAMYFESNRSSEEGMLAVGTVVMNRVESTTFPNDVCAVVSQRGQFAPGVMTKRMDAGRDLAMASAARILRGERYEKVRGARFFHTAGYHFGYPNMHYVAIAGGNSFYEKVGRRLRSQVKLATQEDVRAGKKSFDFAAIAPADADAAERTRALALDAAEKPRTRSPFSALLDALSGTKER